MRSEVPGKQGKNTKAPSILDGAFVLVCLVARAGIEPATFRFSGGRSYQLSYLAGRHPNRMPSAQSPRTGDYCDPDGTRTRDLRRDRAAR